MKTCKFLLLLLLLMVGQKNTFSQGKLVLVGGGTEIQGGWSDAPYQWAVNQSVNKKVAIISYQTQDNWLRNYFLNLGATDATNFTISTTAQANSLATYNDLMNHDVFFFKGGDQSQYYTLYKGTLVEQAVEDKFNAGGVIAGTSAGMAILSSILFSAENGSLFPPDALENINSPYYSLKNDFIHIFPNFVFDTHFAERGRNARLMGFLAKWYQQTGNFVKGIGVDDKTALCIDSSKNATCYGSGAVHIYAPQSFSFPNNKIYTPDLKAHILLHGHQINLNTLTMLQEASSFVSPTVSQENANYQVWLSGGEGISENGNLLQDFVNSGSVNDNILIVTGSDTVVAHQYRQNLRSRGATGNITILQTIAANNQSDKYQLRNAIRLSKKVLFVNITGFANFFQFINGGETGALLNSHIRRNQILNLFIGENSKLAGKIYVTNNRANKYNAYDGNLSFSNGLSLLNTTTILPNAFNPSDNDFYENNSCAVSYAVAKYRLKFGIYLNRNSWLKFYQQAGQNFFTSAGTYSAMVLINGNTRGGLATQIASTATNQPRNIAGFSEVYYALLHGNNTLSVGVPVPTNDENYTLENPVVSGLVSSFAKEVLLYPNPARHFVKIEWLNAPLEVTICDVSGRWCSEKYRGEGFLQINTQFFQKGLYVVLIKNAQNGQILMKKLTIY